MDVRIATYSDLTHDEIAAWSAIQRDNVIFSSPYFRPEFTAAVASVRSDVRIAVLMESGRPVGFFPHHRTQWGAGKPIAGPLSDFHSLIAASTVQCDPLELVRACKLTSWRFNHLVPAHQSFARFVWESYDSPYIELSDGFSAYIAARENGRRIMSEYGQRKRKVEREVGPIRHEPHVPDPEILATCIRWKSDQYLRTKVEDIFEFPWVAELLERIMEFDAPDFGPVVSVTYAGNQIAAINAGFRSGNVLHPLFPTYNVALAHYSPGALHWIETMQAAATIGISKIDLGRGAESYKLRYMTGATRVSEGAIDLHPPAAIVRRAWRHTRQAIKASPLEWSARAPVSAVRRVKC